MLKEGDAIKLSGHTYILGKKIGGGLEGTVFDLAYSKDTVVDCSKFAVKIINSANLSESQIRTVQNRIRYLKHLGDTNKELRKRMSLPREIVQNDLGYVMTKMTGGESLKKYLDPGEQDFKQWYRDKYTLNRRYNLIAGMFNSLREIHISGLIFTDLSPNNIMVKTGQKGFTVFFIDTDNLRSKNDMYSGVLGTPGYMAPELYRKNEQRSIGQYDSTRNGTPVSNLLSKVGRISVDSDIFSAAVIAFQLLTLHHPFVGDVIDNGTAEDEERAHRIETDYIFKNGTDNVSTSSLVPAFDYLTTPEIRRLFYRTFVDGIDNPSLRPTDQEFIDAFLMAKDRMVTCPKCRFSTIYDGQETPCICCNTELGPLPVLRIVQSFSNISPDEILSKQPISEVSKPTEARKEYTISRIVLTPGEERILYRRNFEQSKNRGEQMVTITAEDGKSVTMTLLSDCYPQAMIVNTSSGSGKSFGGNTQRFPMQNHSVLFEEYSESNKNTYCRLEGIFSWE